MLKKFYNRKFRRSMCTLVGILLGIALTVPMHRIARYFLLLLAIVIYSMLELTLNEYIQKGPYPED